MAGSQITRQRGYWDLGYLYVYRILKYSSTIQFTVHSTRVLAATQYVPLRTVYAQEFFVMYIYVVPGTL